MKMWPGTPLMLMVAFPFAALAQGQLRTAFGSPDIPALVQALDSLERRQQ